MPETPQFQWSRCLSLASVLAYVASFVIPGQFEIYQDVPAYPHWFTGAIVFVLGFLFCWAFFSAALAWWANVAYWIALRCRPKRARNWSIIAVLLALTFPFFIRSDSQSGFRSAAYVVWMGSFFLYAVASQLRVLESPFNGESETEKEPWLKNFRNRID